MVRVCSPFCSQYFTAASDIFLLIYLLRASSCLFYLLYRKISSSKSHSHFYIFLNIGSQAYREFGLFSSCLNFFSLSSNYLFLLYSLLYFGWILNRFSKQSSISFVWQASISVFLLMTTVSRKSSRQRSFFYLSNFLIILSDCRKLTGVSSNNRMAVSGRILNIQSSLSSMPFLSSNLVNKLTASSHAILMVSYFCADSATFCQLSYASSYLSKAENSLGLRDGTSISLGFFFMLSSNYEKYLWQYKTGFPSRKSSSCFSIPIQKNHLIKVKSIISSNYSEVTDGSGPLINEFLARANDFFIFPETP